MSPRKLKILIIGNERGVYRSQALLDHLRNSGHHILRVKPNFTSHNVSNKNNLARTRRIITYLIKLFLKTATVDIIYILPLNTDFIISTLWAKLFFKKPLIVDLYISLYDTYVEDTKMFDSTSEEADLILKKDIISFTKSDYIITPFKHQLNYWKQKFAVEIDESKVFISPIFTNSKLKRNRKFVQGGTFRICWWGTFIPLHGLDKVLQAFKILKQKEYNFTCDLFGVEHKSFYEYLETIKINQLNYYVTLRKDLNFADDSLPQYLVNNCDLALGIFGDVDKGKNAVSSKVIDALSMEIPTLTMKSPGLKEFFDFNTDLWTCETSPEAIAEAIESIINGSAPTIDWQQTRQKVLRIFNVTQYQNTINHVLDKATGRDKS